MSAEQSVLCLIEQYVAQSQRACTLLQDGFGETDLLAAVRARRIPEEGILHGLAFSFHGVGCVVQLGKIQVDFDFGPDGRVGGFDAWRLARFAESSDCSTVTADEDTIKAVLLRLLETGEIVAPRWIPSPHLYYLHTRKQNVNEG